MGPNYHLRASVGKIKKHCYGSKEGEPSFQREKPPQHPCLLDHTLKLSSMVAVRAEACARSSSKPDRCKRHVKSLHEPTQIGSREIQHQRCYRSGLHQRVSVPDSIYILSHTQINIELLLTMSLRSPYGRSRTILPRTLPCRKSYRRRSLMQITQATYPIQPSTLRSHP